MASKDLRFDELVNMDNLDKIKSVFDTVIKELVYDCWEDVKPDGYDTIGKWVDSLPDLQKTGHKLPLKSNALALNSKHLEVEMSFTQADGYLWKLVIAP